MIKYTKRRPNNKPPPGKVWKLVEDASVRSEERQEMAMQEVHSAISATNSLADWSFDRGLASVGEFHDHFPGENKVPDEGGWIMVKDSPPTEFTVPPMSFWFAEPWPMEGYLRHTAHRVKVVTPRGDLGVMPREYSLVKDIGKYFPFIGDGIDIVFFGLNGETGIDPAKLFYLRTRGIPKSTAITMLIGEIRQPMVCWLRTRREITDQFGLIWPTEDRLAAA